MLSIAVGAKPIPPSDVWHALTERDAAEHTVVRQLRLPRTLLGLLAGAALGVAGAAMQALTRNPLRPAWRWPARRSTRPSTPTSAR